MITDLSSKIEEMHPQYQSIEVFISFSQIYMCDILVTLIFQNKN